MPGSTLCIQALCSEAESLAGSGSAAASPEGSSSLRLSCGSACGILHSPISRAPRVPRFKVRLSALPLGAALRCAKSREASLVLSIGKGAIAQVIGGPSSLARALWPSRS